MSEQKHTHSLLPWRVGGEQRIYDANGDRVSSTMANQELSVRAVNAHAGLVAALKLVKDMNYFRCAAKGSKASRAFSAVKQALAQAAGEGEL
jgi:hypothetical protein